MVNTISNAKFEIKQQVRQADGPFFFGNPRPESRLQDSLKAASIADGKRSVLKKDSSMNAFDSTDQFSRDEASARKSIVKSQMSTN